MEDGGLQDTEAEYDDAMFARDAHRRDTRAATAGYRAGMDAGRDRYLQVAFELGFGAAKPLSRLVGNMKGYLMALPMTLGTQDSSAQDELQRCISSICSSLDDVVESCIPLQEAEARGSVNVLLDAAEDATLPICPSRLSIAKLHALTLLADDAAALLLRSGMGAEAERLLGTWKCAIAELGSTTAATPTTTTQ